MIFKTPLFSNQKLLLKRWQCKSTLFRSVSKKKSNVNLSTKLYYYKILRINPCVQKALRNRGINVQSNIQLIAILNMVLRIDTGISCVTGSGKTYAFALPLISKIVDMVDALRYSSDTNDDETWLRIGCPLCFGLIVVPTTNLAEQTILAIQSLLPPTIRHICFHLTTNSKVSKINVNRPIIVSTLQTLFRFDYKAILFFNKTSTLILDEVDRMLELQTLSRIKQIIMDSGKNIIGGRHSVFVSASLTYKFLCIAREIAWCRKTTIIVIMKTKKKPRQILYYQNIICDKEILDSNIYKEKKEFKPKLFNLSHHSLHVALKTKNHTKLDIARRCLMTINPQSSLVFTTKQNIKEIHEELSRYQMKFGSLYEKLGVLEKKGMINKFSTGELQTLIANDLVGYGLNFPNCEVVLNLELPSCSNTYLHRAGRVGRAGKEGLVITLFDQKQEFIINRWEKELKITFSRVQFYNHDIVPLLQDL
jgi:superfamily II DNA/RNA helicase